MTTDTDKVQIGFLLICLFNPGWGKLTITSMPFECGKSASIVCSRLDETVEIISWYMNGMEILRCKIDACQYPTLGNYNFTAGGGVWTIAIDPVEWKDNNITFTCEVSSSGGDAPVRVSLTIDVSVPMDISSTLTKIENATDVILKAQTNCVKPVENVDITLQCVKADQVNVFDTDCRLIALPTYTSECRDLNQTCAWPGTYRIGRDVILPVYRGNYFKLVKIKAVFTDGTTVIEKIFGEVKQEVPPRIAPLKDCSIIENTDFSVSCNLSNGDPSTVKCTWTAPSGTISNDCYLRIPSVQRTSSGTYTCRVENSVGTDTRSFYLDILYAPLVHNMRCQRIIEGSTFSQICDTTPGRPTTTYYLWTRRSGRLSENKRVLTIANVTPEHADNYTCIAWNNLNPSFGIPSNGTDQKTFSMEVLFPPKLKAIPNQSVMEGSSFTQNCEFLRHGNPPGKIMWFSLDQAGNEIPIGSVNRPLTIANVSRNHQGSFKCVTENIMDPIDKEMVKGTDFKLFYLSVFYKTVISSLTIDKTEDRLIVSQNKANVLLKCNVSSYPLSQMSLHSTTHSGSRILQKNPSSDHLLYSLSTATCWDSGVYTCSGRNNVTENKVSKAVILLVECTARPLHKVEPIITIYRGVGHDVTLNLTVVAYPLPASELFQWSRLEKDDSTTYMNGSIENLSNSSLDSKLSLTNIQDADFGQYKLAIKYNDIVNAYVQYFSIQPQAEADTRSQNNGAIIGGAVGGGVVLIVVVIVVVVFLRRKYAAKSQRSTDSQRRKANEHDPCDSTTGTSEHNGTNERYNISSNTYEEICAGSSSGPYEDLNRCSGTNIEYSTLNRVNDDKTITPLSTLGTYENLQLTALS